MRRKLALALVSIVVVTSLDPAVSQEATLPGATDAFHLLPPLGNAAWYAENDPSLLPFLRVTVCRDEGEACPVVRESTAETAHQKGGLALLGGAYQMLWDLGHDEVGWTFRISFDVAGLPLGALAASVHAPRTVPVRFVVEPNPRVRARAMRTGGASADEIAAALRAEFGLVPVDVATVLVEEAFGAREIGRALAFFGLDATDLAQTLAAVGFGAGPIASSLRDLGYSAVEAAVALGDGLELDPEPAAQALAEARYGAAEVYEALRTAFGLEEAQAWTIVEGLGYDPDEIFSARAAVLAARFAPQLRFDGGGWTCPEEDSYPMSAQEYFERRTQGQAQRLSNGDASTVSGNLVPTYWKAFRCGAQYRFVYWWFYGYQFDCDCTSGEHEGDWEHLLVVLSEDKTRIAAVTFFQHGGYYTRLAMRGGFALADGTHPIVYPGRNNHGSYHNTQTGAQTCCYWEDHRDGDGPWLSTWIAPLRQLRPWAEGGDPWMDADLAGAFSWGVGTHPMQNMSGNCGQQTCAGTPTWGCHESGCFRSQCEVGDRDDGITCWHCPPGYTDWGFACSSGCSTVSIESYGLRYTISMTDAGLMYHAP